MKPVSMIELETSRRGVVRVPAEDSAAMIQAFITKYGQPKAIRIYMKAVSIRWDAAEARFLRWRKGQRMDVDTYDLLWTLI